ncbi:hypothetical protein TWF696_003563 [Orbilia brochopaga]|uniref:Uncharacterized protein n=1 Tax=Orbilia brochopaga TaxID=3140254 RepID=A0AAV9TY94_9PEZI
MTEFATYPVPLTFMPMPAITMASHRPKRKSGTKTNLEDAVESTRGEELPPLKKTRRASPDRPVDPAPVKMRTTRTTRSTSNSLPTAASQVNGELTVGVGSAVENDEGADNIFSKGPSRAKKAKRNQKEKKQEPVAQPAQVEEPPDPPTTGLRSTSRQAARSPTRTRQPARTTEAAPRPKGVENERPIPIHANGKPATAGRKPKAQKLETPERKPSRVRRSPRINAAPAEVAVEVAVEIEKPLTVPLAAIEDTPLVRKRNKEMREANGHRRSSLGLRGRRASSLTNGHIAAPHPDVQPKDFFKHLDAQMIEIQRMQQLLAWCSKCALSEKRARGRDAQSNARAAARVIEEDILADLTEKKLNVNWWESSEGNENADEIPKKPHPKNEDHKRKIAALEQQLEELNKEKQAWINISELTPAKLPKPQREGAIRPASLDLSLLRIHEASVIPGFEESDKAIDTIQRVMAESRESIEFKVDQFSHGMHKAQQYSRYAKSVSEKVLAQASSVLDMREEAAKKAAGTSALPLHEVLKSISHLDRG